MKKSIFIITAVVVSYCMAACNSKSKAEQMTQDQELASDAQQMTPLPDRDLYGDGKTQLIKSSHYRFQVESVKNTTEAIETAIRKYPAYISTSSLQLENPTLENKMTIRVESEYFELLLKEIDKQAIYVNFRNIATDDVSKEFVDLESRVKTKREVEARYRDILQNKTGTIKEVLEAEKQIADLHEEIEAAVGKINYLRDQVKYSSVQLEFYEIVTGETAMHSETTPGKFGSALKAGFNGLMTVLIYMTYAWPILILIAAAFLVDRFKRVSH